MIIIPNYQRLYREYVPYVPNEDVSDTSNSTVRDEVESYQIDRAAMEEIENILFQPSQKELAEKHKYYLKEFP